MLKSSIKVVLLILILVAMNVNAEILKLKMVANDNLVYKVYDMVSEDKILVGNFIIQKSISRGSETYNLKIFGNELTKNSAGYSDEIKFECSTKNDRSFEKKLSTRFKHLPEASKKILNGKLFPIIQDNRDISSGIYVSANCKPETIKWSYSPNETYNVKNGNNRKNYQSLILTSSKQKYMQGYTLLTPDDKEVAEVYLREKANSGNKAYTTFKGYIINKTNERLKIIAKTVGKDTKKEYEYKKTYNLNAQSKSASYSQDNGIPTFKDVNIYGPGNSVVYHYPLRASQESIEYYIEINKK